MNQLLDALSDAVLVVDALGIVTACNEAGGRLAGSGAEIIGAQVADFVRRDGPVQVLIRPGQDPLRVDVSAGEPLADGSRVLVLKDLTPWLGLEAAPLETGDELELSTALGAVWAGGALADSLHAEQLNVLGRMLVRQGRSLISDCDCLLAQVPPEDMTSFRVVAGEGPWAETVVGQSFEIAGSLAGRALGGSEALETHRAQAESALRSNLVEGGIQSVRLVPMRASQPLPDGRTALGLLGFYRQHKRPFTAVERRLIDYYGRLAGMTVQRLEYRRAAQQAAERLTTVLEIAVDLAGSLDTEQVVGSLIRRASQAAAADRCVLLRVEGTETVVQAAFDARGLPDQLGLRHPIDSQPLMARAVADQIPVPAGRYDVELLPPELRESLRDVCHTLTLPLVLAGEVQAALVLSKRQDREFSREDVATLQLIGNVAVLALRNARLFAEAQEAGRVKSEFLNMAAHELRTPLTVISGYLSMLQDGSFGPAAPAWQGPVLTLTQKSAELGSLIEDLLLAARLETGRLPTRVESIDVAEVLEETVARWQQRADELGADLGVQAPSQAVIVSIDREHLGRILDNLISNALSYRRGRPWIRLRLRTSERGRARIEVEDHGRGIPLEHQERIFERFYRVDDRAHPSPPGTGLGLHISRELAVRHGARLELIASRPGSGSRFALTIPVE